MIFFPACAKRTVSFATDNFRKASQQEMFQLPALFVYPLFRSLLQQLNNILIQIQYLPSLSALTIFE